MKISEFFKENNRFSMTRLTVFMTVTTSIILSIISVYFINKGTMITELNYTIGILLGFAGGIKVGNKYAEMKEENKNVSQ